MDLFFRDQTEYYNRYILGIETPPNESQTLGSIVHNALANSGYEWLKVLKESGLKNKRFIVRKFLNKMTTKLLPENEFYLRAETRNGIKLLSIFDGFDSKNRMLNEYKTTNNDFIWTQKSVDYSDQISFYAYVYWLTFHSFFKEIRLYALNTQKGTAKTFKTTRSRRDMDFIENKINKCIFELKRLGWWEMRKSSKERSQPTLL